jgi:membrane-bound lytic murein transglycosylase MltF
VDRRPGRDGEAPPDPAARGSHGRPQRGVFAFASYNAGPTKIARLRKEAAAAGLNPNVWFNHVEVIAARRIGRETVQYVSNIYKYYVAYSLLSEERERAKESLQKR